MTSVKMFLLLALLMSQAALPQLNNFLVKTSDGELQFLVYGETVNPFAPFDSPGSIQKVKKISKPVVDDKVLSLDTSKMDFKIFETSVQGVAGLKFYYFDKQEIYLIKLNFVNDKSFQNLQQFLGTLFQELKIVNAEPGLSFRKAQYKADVTGTGAKTPLTVTALLDTRGGKKEVIFGFTDQPEVYSKVAEFGYPRIDVDLNALSEQKLFEYYNIMASELYEVVTDAQAFYKKEKVNGGGGNSFVGYQIPAQMKETQNCIFSIESVTPGEIKLIATSKLKVMGQDGQNPLKVRFTTRPDDMQPEVAN